MPSSLHLHRINPLNHTMHQRQQPQPKPTTISLPENSIHHHPTEANQCSSAAVQVIDAEVETVWSVIRRFDRPQEYKKFLKSCHVIIGDGDVGTLREVTVVSVRSIPGMNSTQTRRTTRLGDKLSFSVY